MKNFALIGAAGYIAPRHMRAILETNNNLVAALDTNDSVGIIDSYFPEAAFFTEFERFDRHICKLKRIGKTVDYVSVCSPNYLHDSHIRFGLRVGANVICEKPLMLSPWNLNALKFLEKESGQRIYTILQLRLHPEIIALKKYVDQSPPNKVFDIDLSYITSRGNWYYASWKGNMEKSGGIATNIGVHFFDMLTWIFGEVQENLVHVHTHDRAAGILRLSKANVRWFLSINYKTIPAAIRKRGARTFRSLEIDGKKIEFSKGFTDLHTRSYEAILNNNGFGLATAAKAVEMAYNIRNAQPVGLTGDHHPLAELQLTPHPFEHKGAVEFAPNYEKSFF